MDLNLGQLDFSKLIPLIGDMSHEEKMDFIVRLTEAAARGAAEGAVRGTVCK